MGIGRWRVYFFVQNFFVQMTISGRDVIKNLKTLERNFRRNAKPFDSYTNNFVHCLARSNINFVPLTLILIAFAKGSSKRIVAAKWYIICTSSASVCRSFSEMPRFGSRTSPFIATTFFSASSPSVFFKRSNNCKKFEIDQGI